MTLRSHRRATLKPHSGIVEFELEVLIGKHQQLTYSRFPNADAEKRCIVPCPHNGNPRVQYYLLDKAQTACTNEESLAQLSKTPAVHQMTSSLTCWKRLSSIHPNQTSRSSSWRH